MASVDTSAILPALTASGGLAAAIFTALKYNRDDAASVVTQQSQVLEGMRALNSELQEALDRARADLEAERNARRTLELEVERLRAREVVVHDDAPA